VTPAAPPAVLRRRFDGWIVVAAVSVFLLVAGGLGFYGLSVYLKELEDARGFSVGWISGATSLFFIVGGVVGLVVARLIARHDVRLVVTAGAVIGGVSLALLGQVRELWQLYLVDAALAVGNTCCFLVPGTTVVTRWFVRRRSVALSIASTGISVGGLVFTPLSSSLIGNLGIGPALLWLGLIWFAVVGAAAMFVWPDPASRGQQPDGDPGPVDPAAVAAEGPSGVPYGDAIRSRFFRALVIAYVLGLTAQVGAIIHLYNRVSDDIDKTTASAAVLCVALASVVFRLMGGVVAERVPLTGLTAFMFVLQGIALVVLSAASTTTVIILGSALFGATIGNTLVLQPLIVADAFGVRDYPRIYSLNMMLTTIGVAAGPFVVGLLHDTTDGYGVAYMVAAVLSFVAAVMLASRRRAAVSSSTMAWAASK
jgi:MFS family permease